MRRFLTAALSLSVALAAQDKPAAAKPETRTLQGRVVDVLGEPIPAATVAAVVHGRVVQRTMTDGEGIYLLTRVPAAGAEICFTAPGKAEVRTPWRGLSAPPFRNETLEDAGRLHGRVSDARGTAIAGATVIVLADRYRSEAITNASGDYDFAAVPLRRALLRAWAPTGWVERRVPVAAETRCDLTMPALATGTRVVRVKGLPADALATARVEVTSTDMALHNNQGRVALRADGTAEVMPTECCLVHLVAPGFASDPVGYLICGGEAPIEFEVAPLQAKHTVVKGRARDGRNRPIAGVRVVVRDRSGCDVCSDVTSATGAFVLAAPLPPDSFCRLGLELGDWYLVDASMSIADGFSWIQTTADPKASRDLFAERTGDLRSELRGESGTRFVFADVVVADVVRAHKALVRTTSDRAGRVELRLPPGDYDLFATGTDGQITKTSVRITETQPAPKVSWTPLPSGSIEGVLLDGSGQPVPGVDLVVASQEMEGGASAREKSTVVTDRNGRFRCRGLSPGPWTVVGSQPGIESAAGDVTKDKTTNVVLRLSR